MQAVQSLHKFHQVCDLFDEPWESNTGKVEHYLLIQRILRKKTHVRPRPHVSGYFFSVLPFRVHVKGRRFGRQNRVEYLKTPSCRFLVDGRKRGFFQIQ